ncbi:B3 domain-containing protein Os01g0905400-like [Lolium rigidum]|uniref:B3 domain-containing protein Os01g0905400-like n=1 Tax=Lolium rigidum TaxID=89674 RepID=UPI001F5DB886|nr:B3 domain-containing protein Os01g0905400-like [Lolium rigidum]
MVDMVELIKIEQEDGTAVAGAQEERGAEKLGSHKEQITSGKVKKTRRKQSVSDQQWKRACMDCTKRCARVHGRAASSSSDKAPPATPPSFFKVMMGHFSENMEIPPPFAKTIADLAGSYFYLEDAFGLRWRVRLCCSLDSGRLSFGQGWKNFVLDHAVAVGEFLVFTHIAKSVFAVQIFAKSACERLYLCEKNKRQSRKRKPKEKTSLTGDGTVRASKKSTVGKDKCGKKKQRTDSDLLDEDQAHDDQDQENVADAYTESEKCEGSSFLTGAELSTPLAMMNIDDEITDDIFLTADAYQFEADLCNQDTEAFSVETGMNHLAVAHGQTSGFSCAEPSSWNCESSVGVCLENKEIAGLPVTSTDADNDPDNKESPGNELSTFRADKSSCDVDAQVPPSELVVETFKKDGEYSLSPPGDNHNPVERRQEAASAKQDIEQQMQEDPGHNVAEIMPGDTNPGELSELNQGDPAQTGKNLVLKSECPKTNNRKFCVAVPPPDQTWLEFPCRLPVLPRRKKHGRKVLVVEDPCTRHWPVLYLCTPSFSGLVTGWADVHAENGLNEGDTCELELHSSNSNLALRVRVPGSQ